MTPEEIKELRGRLGLSQRAMAQAVNVHELTIRRWEKGHKVPRPLCLEKLHQLRDSLTVSKDELRINGIPISMITQLRVT